MSKQLRNKLLQMAMKRSIMAPMTSHCLRDAMWRSRLFPMFLAPVAIVSPSSAAVVAPTRATPSIRTMRMTTIAMTSLRPSHHDCFINIASMARLHRFQSRRLRRLSPPPPCHRPTLPALGRAVFQPLPPLLPPLRILLRFCLSRRRRTRFIAPTRCFKAIGTSAFKRSGTRSPIFTPTRHSRSACFKICNCCIWRKTFCTAA